MKKLTLLFALCAALGANADDYNPMNAPKFYGVNFTNVDFNTSEIVYNSEYSPYYNGVLYKDLDLRSSYFSGGNFSGTSFENKDVSNATFTFCRSLHLANFGGADISNISIKNSSFTKEQLISTANYQNKNLKGINISASMSLATIDFSGVNFSEFDLTGTYLFQINLINADFTNFTYTNFFGVAQSDLRGAKGLTNEILQNMTSGPLSYVSPDGSVYAEDEVHTIVFKNTLNSIEAHINTNSVFRYVKMDKGAFLRIDEGVTITAGDTEINGDLYNYAHFAFLLGDNNECGKVQVDGVFNIGDSKIYAHTDDTFKAGEYYEFTLFETEGDGVINGEYIKSKVSVDGSSKGEWDVISTANKVMLVFIPEPAEYAAIFALLALGFAVYFKRKN